MEVDYAPEWLVVFDRTRYTLGDHLGTAWDKEVVLINDV